MLSVVLVVVTAVSVALLPLVIPAALSESGTESQRLVLFGLALYVIAGVWRFVNARPPVVAERAAKVTAHGPALLAD
jgi:hypothetical protein